MITQIKNYLFGEWVEIARYPHKLRIMSFYGDTDWQEGVSIVYENNKTKKKKAYFHSANGKTSIDPEFILSKIQKHL